MKERWQKQREKERTGRRRKKISAHWAKLFVLGKHCNEKCEYWWDNRECYITLYEEEARKLIESLNGFNLKLDFIDLEINQEAKVIRPYLIILDKRICVTCGSTLHTIWWRYFTNSLFVNSQEEGAAGVSCAAGSRKLNNDNKGCVSWNNNIFNTGRYGFCLPSGFALSEVSVRFWRTSLLYCRWHWDVFACC